LTNVHGGSKPLLGWLACFRPYSEAANMTKECWLWFAKPLLHAHVME